MRAGRHSRHRAAPTFQRSKLAAASSSMPPHREVVVVEAEARGEGVGLVRLVGDPRHIVGAGGVEPAVEAGIGDAAGGEGVLPEQAVGLAEQRVDEAALVELRGILHAVIGAAAALDAVPAGELVDAEQVAVVEDQALRVLVRPFADLRFVRPRDHLRDRLDGLRAPGFHADERIAVFDADRRHGAHQVAVAGVDVVGHAGIGVDLHGGGVGAQRRERREHLAERVGEAAPPMRLRREAAVGAGNAAQQAVGRVLDRRVGGLRAGAAVERGLRDRRRNWPGCASGW